MTFKRIGGSDKFDIEWRGDIALAYAGRLALEYKFRAEVLNVQMPQLEE
jgi:hypothetical protein